MRYLVILSLLAVTSCKTKPSCKQVVAASKLSAVATATILDCSGLDAIEKDIFNEMNSLDFCQKLEVPAQLTGNPLLCEAVSSYVSKQVVKLTPSSWECRGGIAGTAIQAGVYQACLAYLPVSQKN